MPELRRLFHYNRWANREALASVRSAAPPPARSLKLLGHVVGAEVLWHARLTSQSSPLAVWPDLAGRPGGHVGAVPRAGRPVPVG